MYNAINFKRDIDSTLAAREEMDSDLPQSVNDLLVGEYPKRSPGFWDADPGDGSNDVPDKNISRWAQKVIAKLFDGLMKEEWENTPEDERPDDYRDIDPLNIFETVLDDGGAGIDISLEKMKAGDMMIGDEVKKFKIDGVDVWARAGIDAV